MKNRLMRPTAALFPLALLAADLVNKQRLGMDLMRAFIFMQILILFPVESFSIAAAREPGLKRVDKRFWGSMTMFLLGVIGIFQRVRLSYEINSGNMFTYVTALIIIFEQLFEERLFTLNRHGDGSMLAWISNGLLFVGLMLDGAGSLPAICPMFYTLAAAGLGAFIAVITCLIIAPSRGFSLIPLNLQFVLKAAVQNYTFPLLWEILLFKFADFDPNGTGLLCGMALWRLSRTVCRRSADESRGLGLQLMTVTGALTIAACWFDALVMPSFCCWLALACAMVVYLRPSIQNVLGTLFLAGSFALKHFELGHFYYNLPVIGCCAIALILNLKNAFLKKV